MVGFDDDRATQCEAGATAVPQFATPRVDCSRATSVVIRRCGVRGVIGMLDSMARAKTPKVTTASKQSAVAAEHHGAHDRPNPVWFKPIMFGFMLIGLVWILTFYVSGGQFPIPNLGAMNIAIGFGLMFIGFLMTTRWR